mmetsp:Transcript_7589/g.23373  ORF Transcript_7589/g.23373 Transcript_7589/m.23373 type:complete len:241 (-) Transcript_7589:139-861(-)
MEHRLPQQAHGAVGQLPRAPRELSVGVALRRGAGTTLLRGLYPRRLRYALRVRRVSLLVRSAGRLCAAPHGISGTRLPGRLCARLPGHHPAEQAAAGRLPGALQQDAADLLRAHAHRSLREHQALSHLLGRAVRSHSGHAAHPLRIATRVRQHERRSSQVPDPLQSVRERTFGGGLDLDLDLFWCARRQRRCFGALTGYGHRSRLDRERHSGASVQGRAAGSGSVCGVHGRSAQHCLSRV